jgi:hypothetical protein
MLPGFRCPIFELYSLRKEKCISFRVSPHLRHLLLEIGTGLIFLPKSRGEDVFVLLVPSPIHHLRYCRILIFTFKVRIGIS